MVMDIWVEKYRPQVLEDLVGNDLAVEKMRCIVMDGNMLNLILTGPPGCGKTTSVHCMARALLGDLCKTAVLELNASDERGIDVVRNKIKMFAQTKMTLPEGRHKIVILDEADSMTEAAQQAMRRTMEMFSSSTRFCLACNQSTKLIEPIQSRCAILRFTRVHEKDVAERIKKIIHLEGLQYDSSGIDAIVFSAEGDLRNALNNLQSTANGFGAITKANVFKVCDQPHPNKIRGCIRSCVHDEFQSAWPVIMELHEQGYPAVEIVGMVFKVLKSFAMPENLKLELLKETGLYHMRAFQGCATLTQLAGLVAKLCLIGRRCNIKLPVEEPTTEVLNSFD